MRRQTFYAGLIASALAAVSHLAVHYAIGPVALAASLESRLFQPDLRPSGRQNATALAEFAIAAIR